MRFQLRRLSLLLPQRLRVVVPLGLGLRADEQQQVVEAQARGLGVKVGPRDVELDAADDAGLDRDRQLQSLERGRLHSQVLEQQVAVEDVQLELALVKVFDVLSEQDVEHRAAQRLHRRARAGRANGIRAGDACNALLV